MTDLVVNQGGGKRDIVVSAKATSIEKWRKQVVAGQPETGREYAFISDEGWLHPRRGRHRPQPVNVLRLGHGALSHFTRHPGGQ